jgi:hypothetical protein
MKWLGMIEEYLLMTRSECAEFGEKFCVLWSTAGYLAQSCLVPCLAALFSLLFIFLHRGTSLVPHTINSANP